ncbi:MAG: response regulator [Elusimicrobia bacterium]|nr:response regulator [Elusimicrobiota bacterium]
MKKIFMIDDNEEFKDMIHDYFSSIGYEVILASSGKNSVKESLTVKPDLIFLDVMMPDKSGIEIIRELQEYDEMKKIPVIVITGSYFESNMKEVFSAESNCREFLTKAIDLSVLEKKVFDIIGK